MAVLGDGMSGSPGGVDGIIGSGGGGDWVRW